MGNKTFETTIWNVNWAAHQRRAGTHYTLQHYTGKSTTNFLTTGAMTLLNNVILEAKPAKLYLYVISIFHPIYPFKKGRPLGIDGSMSKLYMMNNKYTVRLKAHIALSDCCEVLSRWGSTLRTCFLESNSQQ